MFLVANHISLSAAQSFCCSEMINLAMSVKIDHQSRRGVALYGPQACDDERDPFDNKWTTNADSFARLKLFERGVARGQYD